MIVRRLQDALRIPTLLSLSQIFLLKFSLAVTAFDIFNEDEWRDEKTQ